MPIPCVHLFDPEDSGPDSQLVSEIVQAFLDHQVSRLANGDFSPGLLDRQRRHLVSFLSYLGEDFGFLNLKQFHFTEWWQLHADVWKSDYSKRDAIDSVMACFRWAADEQRIDRNPLRRPKMRFRPTPREPLREEHYKALMWEGTSSLVRRPWRMDIPECRRRRRHGSLSLRRAVWFMRYTGARPGEMRNASLADVDFATGVMVLTEHKTSKATGKPRLIGLPKNVLAWLSRVAADVASSPTAKVETTTLEAPPPIFLNCDGEPWTRGTWCHHFRRHADRAGLPKKLVSYCLRHGVATEAAERGHSDREIADLLGHTSTKLVSHYAGGSGRNRERLAKLAEEATKRDKEK